jgi:hypothetical protein
MRVIIDKNDTGKRFTYDGVQLFKIQHVDMKDASIKVKDANSSDTTRARMTIERLEMLFECGRAEWGNCLDDDGDSVVKAGW